MSQKGLTLIEIIVSALILALVLTGLANVFVAGKRYIMQARGRMTAAELGKYFLEPLQMQVNNRQGAWGNNCLSQNGTNPSGCDTTPWTDSFGNITYAPTYNNTAVGVGGLRRVSLTITWSTLQP